MAETHEAKRRVLTSLDNDILVNTESTGFQRFLQHDKIELYRHEEVIEYQMYTEIIETVKSIQLTSVTDAPLYQGTIFSNDINIDPTGDDPQHGVSSRHSASMPARHSSKCVKTSGDKAKKSTKSFARESKSVKHTSKLACENTTVDSSQKENSHRLRRSDIDVSGDLNVSKHDHVTSRGSSSVSATSLSPFTLKPWSPPPAENYVKDFDPTAVTSHNTFSIKKKKKRCKKSGSQTKSMDKVAKQLNLKTTSDVTRSLDVNLDRTASNNHMYLSMEKTPSRMRANKRASYPCGHARGDAGLPLSRLDVLPPDTTYCEPTMHDRETVREAESGVDRNLYDTAVHSCTSADNTYASLIDVPSASPAAARHLPPTPPPPRVRSLDDVTEHDVTLTDDVSSRHSNSSHFLYDRSSIADTGLASSSTSPYLTSSNQCSSQRRTPTVKSRFRVVVPTYGVKKTCSKKLRTLLRRFNLRTKRQNIESLKRVLHVPEAHTDAKLQPLSDRFHNYSVNDIADSYYGLVSALPSDEQLGMSINSDATNNSCDVTIGAGASVGAADLADSFSMTESRHAGIDRRPKAIVKPRTVPVVTTTGNVVTLSRTAQASGGQQKASGNTVIGDQFYC